MRRQRDRERRVNGDRIKIRRWIANSQTLIAKSQIASGIAFAVGGWGGVEDAEEGTGEMALIIETAVHSDRRYGGVGLA